MKYESLFIMVRVAVHAGHTSVTEIVNEVETQSKLNLTDTANVNILETEILLSRARNIEISIMTNVKEKIWKVIGKDIDSNATSTEAILQPGLDFEVAKYPNLHALPSGNNIISDNSFFTFRTDTEAVLGVKIGRDYEVVQNIDAFSFFDSIVGGRGGIHYETAGALGYGETIFITAKLPEQIRVGRDDLIFGT